MNLFLILKILFMSDKNKNLFQLSKLVPIAYKIGEDQHHLCSQCRGYLYECCIQCQGKTFSQCPSTKKNNEFMHVHCLTIHQ
jgi:hypothetical protein